MQKNTNMQMDLDIPIMDLFRQKHWIWLTLHVADQKMFYIL